MAVQTKTERVISLENINKSYQKPNGQQIIILENISLELQPEEIVALVWNSVMSVAGGCFFLSAIESFTLKKKFFHLPGLGSYLATAADWGDVGAIVWGLLVLLEIILLIDFLVWRPLIAWAKKFKFKTVEAQNPPQSVVLDFWQRSPTLKFLKTRLWKTLGQTFGRGIRQPFPHPTSSSSRNRSWIVQWLNWLLLSGLTFIIGWRNWEAAMLLRVLNWAEWQTMIIRAILTALRVLTALVLSLASTVPVGLAIGCNPRLAQNLQPLVQIAASVPTTALFPLLLLALTHLDGGLQLGSIVLMMLGTMWYVLFNVNVMAGAQSIPSDLFEAVRVYKLSRWQHWKTVILPGIFSYLITGIITAVGGARTMPVLSANTSTLKVESSKLQVWVQLFLKPPQQGIFPYSWGLPLLCL
ncbi:MAG: ABC transporter permease subunit [Cyanobacteriota bacterium]